MMKNEIVKIAVIEIKILATPKYLLKIKYEIAVIDTESNVK
jgi:hypothetical protein